MGYLARTLRIYKRNIFRKIYEASLHIPYFHFIKNTKGNGNGCTFKLWFFQKVLGFNRHVYWPVDFRSKVNQWQNISVGIDVAPGIEPGCYIQGMGGVYIGDYTRIAQNVGIISTNHNLTNLRKANRKRVVIGKYCWLGMNSVVLPGVTLGDHTVVGAGSVVTSSFEEGYCVIGGVPARKIKDINPEECIKYETKHSYYGYIKASEFETFKKDYLWVE